MGLVTIPGTEIQYFSLSEEITAIATKFFGFILGVSPGWILLITTISLVFIILGVFYRMQLEIKKN